MSRYIDADALPRHGQRGGLVHWKDIEEAPTIDIVFCKDCKYYYDTDGYDDGFGWCDYICTDRKQNDFCSCGVRKESE